MLQLVETRVLQRSLTASEQECCSAASGRQVLEAAEERMAPLLAFHIRLCLHAVA